MASSAIFLTIIIPIAIASGFRIEGPQPNKSGFSAAPAAAVDYRSQPIAGYPKVPPPNAHLSGGSDDDLLPPFENHFFKRDVQSAGVDPKTGYPLVAEPSWKDAGGNEEHLEPPLDDSVNAGEQQGAVDPKTGYPFLAQPHWKDAGGDGEIIAPPLEDTEENFGQKKEEVDPKTGYPLKANPSWKFAGGDGEILELPLEDLGSTADKAVDPKTGYPLVAEEGWKHAGGDGEILELPLEEPKEAVDPKTGYPLQAQPGWKDAGGDGTILELPLEEPEGVPVDPKTGYPLVAEPGWKDAGGTGDFLQAPLERAPKQPSEGAVDPKTGYPLIAQPGWKDAGGDGDILELPLETQNGNTEAQEVSGRGEQSGKQSEAVDPKTGYPLIAQPHWKDAGGNEDILELPLEQSTGNVGVQARSGRVEQSEAVDPKTGYPLVAQPQWKDAGGDENILELPLEPNSKEGTQGRYEVFEIYKLTELQPPPLEKNFPTVSGNSFSTPSPFTRKQSLPGAAPVQNQKRNSSASQTRFGGFNDPRPIESSYTYVGPENVVVTVTRFLNTNRQQTLNQQQQFMQNFRSGITERSSAFNFHGEVPAGIFPQTGRSS